jgi:hypothetical protein
MPFYSNKSARLLFVHIPKNAGSFFQKTLVLNGFKKSRYFERRHPRGHRLLSEEYHSLRPFGRFLWRRVPKVAFFRSPLDWHSSFYRYVKGDHQGRESGHPIEHALFSRISFEEYLECVVEQKITGHPHRYYYRQQTDYLRGFDDFTFPLRVTEVTRPEALTSVCGSLVDIPRERVNVSKVASSEIGSVSAELVERLNQCFPADHAFSRFLEDEGPGIDFAQRRQKLDHFIKLYDKCESLRSVAELEPTRGSITTALIRSRDFVTRGG